jgi:hypothetical protein
MQPFFYLFYTINNVDMLHIQGDTCHVVMSVTSKYQTILLQKLK